MATPKHPSVSVVIPVYNESRRLARCLDALSRQTRAPDEIIVVDNNSTDDSVEIARRYPLVRIITEKKQGITHARSAGFDAARSDVIARIDADSVVRSDWVQTLHQIFADETVDAATDTAGVAELSLPRTFWASWYYRLFRWWHQRSLGVGPILYGFNSALRRAAWPDIRTRMTDGDDTISEDVDVSLALIASGHRLVYTPRLMVKCAVLRSFDVAKMRRYYRTDGVTLAKYQLGNKKRWPQ